MLQSLDMKGWEHTAWCVPSAFAAVTGVPVAKAHSLAAFSTGRDITEIEGMPEGEILLLARRLGVALTRIDLEAQYPEPPRLRDYVPHGQHPMEWLVPCLLVLADKRRRGWHMIAVQYGLAVDNWVERPTRISDFPDTYRHVTQAWTVRPSEGGSHA